MLLSEPMMSPGLIDMLALFDVSVNVECHNHSLY